MPKGYIITRWTEDQGLIVQFSFPEKLIVDLDDMMRIFYAHITGAAEAGNVLVRLAKTQSNVSSFFTGMNSRVPFMINLMLELDEDPELFGETVISEINSNILNYLNLLIDNPAKNYEINNELKNYINTSLFLLERLKNLSKEQRMAQIYISEKGRNILEFLQERAYSRKELRTFLEERLGKSIINFEAILDPFVKTDLIKQDWTEGDQDITLFLLSDFKVMRKPAEKVIEGAKRNLPSQELAQKYLAEVNKFFSSYQVDFADSIKIAANIINPDQYDYITLFREKAYPLNKVPKGPGESFEQTKKFIKALEDDKILTIIKDNTNNEWVFLLSDPIAYTFYPEYLIEKIRQDIQDRKLNKKIAIRHLELLEQVYEK
ncbi:MAG: hypothetical protein ACFFKA_21555 [Candidatus Thorarchaeota archaeon]